MNLKNQVASWRDQQKLDSKNSLYKQFRMSGNPQQCFYGQHGGRFINCVFRSLQHELAFFIYLNGVVKFGEK